jgi:hypothetical protein
MGIWVADMLAAGSTIRLVGGVTTVGVLEFVDIASEGLDSADCLLFANARIVNTYDVDGSKPVISLLFPSVLAKEAVLPEESPLEFV